MNNRGFTLVELMIAMIILLVGLLGFFGWATSIISSNAAMEKINVAGNIALDVGDRLQRMYDNVLIQPKSGNAKFVGFSTSSTSMGYLSKCVSGAPTGTLTTNATGLTEFTEPWANSKLYLYDNNTCSESNLACYGGATITASTNANIDHPNTSDPTTGTNSITSVSPIRFIRDTTYYAVWSVAYLPCGTSDTDKRKIFITVYWLEPEPTDTTVSAVQTKITSGVYTVKSVSIVTDKVIGVEKE